MFLASTVVTAYACGVPASTIRTWAHRGLLTQYGTPRRRLYDLEEAQRLAEQRKLDNHPDQPQH